MDDVDGRPSPVTELGRRMVDSVAQVVLGQEAGIQLAVAGLLSGQHLLLHDEPGVGKTTLARALARALGGSFARIQGTVDLLPGDLTGVTLVDPRSGSWAFRPGPLLSNVVLVDEINRLSPRTQSALLEAMAEGQVTVDGESHAVPEPFVVIATMNPAGSSGTFPFATGQLDRFGLSISLGASPRDIERRLLGGEGGFARLETVTPVGEPGALLGSAGESDRVAADPRVIEYVLDLCDEVRRHRHLSTRAPLSVLRIARSWALLDGRAHVAPDDVKAVAVAALGHRAAASSEELDEGAEVVRRALDDVGAPRP